MRSRIVPLLAILFLSISILGPAVTKGQENARRVQALTNADVIRQVQLGDSDAEIVSNIDRHQTAFVFDGIAMAALTKAGVSSDVKRAMFESALREGAPKTPDAPPPQPVSGAPVAAATPTFDPAAGTFPSAQSVKIGDSTPGAKIYYTIDGTTPTASSSQYANPISVGSTETIKAIAVAPNFSNSRAGSATYTINLPGVTPPGAPPPGTTPPAVVATTPQTAETIRSAATNSAIVNPTLTPIGAGRSVTTKTPSKTAGTMTLDWRAVSTHEVYSTGEYSFAVAGVNDILYQYELTVNLNAAYSADNIAALASAMKSTVAPTPAATLPQGCNTLEADYEDANNKASAIQSALSGLLPVKQSDGKYPSILLNQTLNQWDDIKTKIPAYVTALGTIKTELSNNSCTSTDAPDVVSKSAQLIVDYNGTIKPKLESIDVVASGTHNLNGEGFLDRTRGGSVVVRELYGGSDTAASPRTFPLEPTYNIVSASGGFLLTTLPARSYSSVNQPSFTMPPTSSTVLGVSGNSNIRPALTALLNFHDPFPWYLNRPNFGFALSAGPVIEVANGQSDTTKFGFFGGVSMHLWRQVFITPGIHVGQFADFPQGFTQAGQPIPPNFGTLSPTTRYTARFAFAITFRGSNPSSLLGTGSSKSTSQPAAASPASPSGPKQQ
jgi:hypothetical protein